MSIELKPCPFCGGEPTMSSYTYSLSGAGIQYKVECERHDCPAQPTVDWHYWTAEEAAEAWNTRVERTCRDTGRYCFTCSECGWVANEPHHMLGGFWPEYCPNCGAKVVDA